MRPAFHAAAVSIDTLLGGPDVYHVPAYQRQYCWSKREVLQLLDDLVLALDDARDRQEEPSYFLGSILVVERSDPNGAAASRQLDIVDGKQRLVTLSILLAVLRDLIGREAADLQPLLGETGRGEDADWRPRIQLVDEERGYFEAQIREPGSILRHSGEEDLAPSEEVMRQNRDAILHEIDNLGIEDLRSLAGLVRHGVHVALITTPNVDLAYRIFSVINGRGLPLGSDDILKAQLTVGIAEPRRGGLVARWDTARQELNGNFERLFSHIRTIYGGGHSNIVEDITRIAKRSGGEGAFIESIVLPMARRLSDITRARGGDSSYGAEIGVRLAYLNWLRSTDWIPPLLVFMERHAERPELIPTFLTELDRLAHGLGLLGHGAEKREKRYRALIAAIREGEFDDPQTFPELLTPEEQRNVLYNASRDLHMRSQQMCKLVLLRLDAAISGETPHPEPKECTVEHVLPRRFGESSPWRSLFPDADEREDIIGRLGNLVLLSERQNRRARNLPFSEKRLVYFEDGRSSGFALTDQLRDCEIWSPDVVRRRDAMLMERLRNLWRLHYVDATNRNARTGHFLSR